MFKTKRKTDVKEIIILIAVLLVGAALTAGSLCVYYLVKPQSVAALIVLCVVDFAYTLFSSCWLLNQAMMEKWLKWGIILAFGYVAAFIALPSVCLAVSGALELLQNNILGIVYYSFYTGPCIIIILAVITLIMCFM